MDEDYRRYRLNERATEIKRLVEVLRAVVERNVPPNTALDGAIDNLDLELTLLANDLRRK